MTPRLTGNSRISAGSAGPGCLQRARLPISLDPFLIPAAQSAPADGVKRGRSGFGLAYASGARARARACVHVYVNASPRVAEGGGMGSRGGGKGCGTRCALHRSGGDGGGETRAGARWRARTAWWPLHHPPSRRDGHPRPIPALNTHQLRAGWYRCTRTDAMTAGVYWVTVATRLADTGGAVRGAPRVTRDRIEQRAPRMLWNSRRRRSPMLFHVARGYPR